MTTRDRARRLNGRGRGRPITPGTRAELDDALAEVAELLAEPMTPEQSAEFVRLADDCARQLAAIVGMPPPPASHDRG